MSGYERDGSLRCCTASILRLVPPGTSGSLETPVSIFGCNRCNCSTMTVHVHQFKILAPEVPEPLNTQLPPI